MEPIQQTRYEIGVERLMEIGGECIGEIGNKAAEVAPDFGRLMIEYAFGDVYSRPEIDLRTREMSAIAALAALGTAMPQLRAHVAAALHVGWTRESIIEVLMQTSIYAGFPAALNALAGCHDLLRPQ